MILSNAFPSRDVAGTITTDYEAGASRAVDHLVTRGRRRIAIIAGPRNSFGGRCRLVGIRKSLTAHGLEALSVVHCEPTVVGGHSVAEEMLRETPEIDALICYNDLNAIGAVKACRAGIAIPQQVALVGFDDIPAAELLSPALTTLRVHKREMGEEAVRLLLSRIATKNWRHGIVIEPELIVRETT